MSISKRTKPNHTSCHLCFNNFTRASALKRHMLSVHARPESFTYRCEMCGQAFARKDTLQRHLAAHDRKNYLQCHGCGKSFRGDFLKYHLNTPKNNRCRALLNSELNARSSSDHGTVVSNVVEHGQLNTSAQLVEQESGATSTSSTSNQDRFVFAAATWPDVLSWEEILEDYFGIDVNQDWIRL